MSNPSPSSEPMRSSATRSLRADHEALEALAQSVMKNLVEGDHAHVAAAVGELQSRVTAHLETEERELLDDYAKDAPEDARELVLEHGVIRKVLAELDVAVDLHLVRADAIDAFLRVLRAHSLREDQGLYRWAERVKP